MHGERCQYIHNYKSKIEMKDVRKLRTQNKILKFREINAEEKSLLCMMPFYKAEGVVHSKIILPFLLKMASSFTKVKIARAKQKVTF